MSLPDDHAVDLLTARIAILMGARPPYDPNPFPRFRLWSWWPRARHT